MKTIITLTIEMDAKPANVLNELFRNDDDFRKNVLYNIILATRGTIADQSGVSMMKIRAKATVNEP